MTPIQPEGDILSRRNSTLRGRLMRGFSATALSPVVTAVVQLVLGTGSAPRLGGCEIWGLASSVGHS